MSEIEQLKAENKVLMDRMEDMYSDLHRLTILPLDLDYSEYDEWFDLDGKALRPDVSGGDKDD